MRKITFTVYSYSELSQKAKYKTVNDVVETWLEDIEIEERRTPDQAEKESLKKDAVDYILKNNSDSDSDEYYETGEQYFGE
jgi:hypothetical protein